MDKIGIIINPRAKSVKRSRRDLAALYKEIGGDMVQIRKTSSFEELEQACLDFKKGGFSCVAVAGGDGSAHHVITRLINVYKPGPPPPVLMLRGGTMENIARDVPLEGLGPAILKRYMEKINQGRPIEKVTRDTVRINNSYGFIFGTGIVVNVLREAYDCKEPCFSHNLLVIFRAVRDGILNKKDSRIFKKMTAHVYVDDKEIPFRELLGVIASTVEHKGMGFHLLPRANEKPGTFQAIISGLSPLDVVRQVFRVKKGLPLLGEKNFNDIGSRIRIVSDEPVHYTLDGDLYAGDKEVILEMGPQVELVKV